MIRVVPTLPVAHVASHVSLQLPYIVILFNVLFFSFWTNSSRNCVYELCHIYPFAMAHIKIGQLSERIVLKLETEKQGALECVNIFLFWLKWGKIHAYLPKLRKQLARY